MATRRTASCLETYSNGGFCWIHQTPRIAFGQGRKGTPTRARGYFRDLPKMRPSCTGDSSERGRFWPKMVPTAPNPPLPVAGGSRFGVQPRSTLCPFALGLGAPFALFARLGDASAGAWWPRWRGPGAFCTAPTAIRGECWAAGTVRAPSAHALLASPPYFWPLRQIPSERYPRRSDGSTKTHR